MSALVFINMIHSRKRKEKKKTLIKQQKFIKDGKGKLPLAERMLPVHQDCVHFLLSHKETTFPVLFNVLS